MLAHMTTVVDASLSVEHSAITPEPEQAMPAALQGWMARIRAARQNGDLLRVRGGGTKDHVGDISRGQVLSTADHRGVVAYEPSELVLTACAGTPLADIEALLAGHGQHLAFEPPRWGRNDHDTKAGTGATIGGVVASGFSGPARAARGAVRDHVLGVRMINGRAQLLRFGGAVMKNVAGFDLSRLMTGSMGTLGVLVDVTLKVLPQPPAACTLRFEMPQAQAIEAVNRWAGQPLPLDASVWWDGLLVLRLRGARAAVALATEHFMRQLGGQVIPPELADTFWQGLRDHDDEFFERARELVHERRVAGATLWRLSVPPTTPPLPLPGETLIEWGGAQRWLCTTAPAAMIHEVVAAAGGHALAWQSSVPQPVVLPDVLTRLHRQVQQAFDPDGVFDTGRLWPRAAD